MSSPVPIKGGGTLCIALPTTRHKLPVGLETTSLDHAILQTAIEVRDRDSSMPTVFVTMDTNLRIRADAVGVTSQTYENPRVDDDDIEQSVVEVSVAPDLISTFFEKGGVEVESPSLYPNAGVLLRNEQSHNHTALGRYIKQRSEVVGLHVPREGVMGVRPRNKEQSIALDILLDDSVRLVSLMGKAGTGKTLLALAAGLQRTTVDRTYSRLLVSRPIMPLGRDLGFLPGDIDDKLNPWMQPIFDNLEYIFSHGPQRGERDARAYMPLVESGVIQVEPLTYIRGRSLPRPVLDRRRGAEPHAARGQDHHHALGRGHQGGADWRPAPNRSPLRRPRLQRPGGGGPALQARARGGPRHLEQGRAQRAGRAGRQPAVAMTAEAPTCPDEGADGRDINLISNWPRANRRPPAWQPPAWEPRASRALRRVGEQLLLIGAATPLNLAAELTALETDFAAGRTRLPAFRYAAPPPDVRAPLDSLIRQLAGYEGALAKLYLDRAREMMLEAELCQLGGRPPLRDLARRRYTPHSHDSQAAELAQRWARLQTPVTGKLIRSDDAAHPQSLLSRMRAELGRKRLPFRVQVSRRLAALAATGLGVIYVAARRQLRVQDVERTVLHEIAGHAAPQAAAQQHPLGLALIGSAGGSDDQEGRALWLEQQAGLLCDARKRELGLRHIMACAAHEGASFVEAVEQLRQLDTALPDALRIAARALRGGGLGRERVYLPALLRVSDALAMDPRLQDVLAQGKWSIAAATVLLRQFPLPQM